MLYVKPIFTEFQTTFLLVLRKKLANYRNGFFVQCALLLPGPPELWAPLLTMAFFHLFHSRFLCVKCLTQNIPLTAAPASMCP